MDTIEEGYVGRQTLYVVGMEMAADNQPLGTGPGSFSHLYQFYRRSPDDDWPAMMHNDWLQAVITFGWVGLAVQLLPFLLVLMGCKFGKGVKIGLMPLALFWVALGGCMLHAWVDFPFQVHSVRALFTILCAVLSCLSLTAKHQ